MTDSDAMQADHILMTRVNVPDLNPAIRYQDPLFMAGSCFSEHICAKLDRYKYEVLSNPFGILYNPTSLANALSRICTLSYYVPEELVLHQGYYHSMDHHGSFSGKDPDVVADKINKAIDNAYVHLQKSRVIFISPGTANVFIYQPTGQVAGNNHKLPSTHFLPQMLSLQECIDSYETINAAIKHIAPNARIVWTVSPVRHIRDGLIENQRSKATLLLAIHEVMKNHPSSNYFPAYEIMVDELRDYRYYERDMIHPSPMAIDLIWSVFSKHYLSPEDRAFHPLIEKIQRATEHRFLHDDRDAIRTFASGQLKQIDELSKLMPDLNWQRERQYFFQYLELD